MAITKQTVVDQSTITENGIILYRAATKIIEDGVELTKTITDHCLTRGQDLTGQPAQVVAIANTVWTRSHCGLSSRASRKRNIMINEALTPEQIAKHYSAAMDSVNL
jgi:hypothetical protein